MSTPKTAAPTDSAPNDAEGRIVAFRSEIHTPEAEFNANVPLDLIERDPANRVPTDAAVAAIAASIEAEGLLQPVVLRPTESGKYQLIAGEHRWRAYLFLKRETIPARIYKSETELSAARKSAIENFSREQLTPIERARKFKQLADLGMKQKEIGAMLGGLSQPVVANAMRLLDLPEAVQAEIIEGRLSEAHGVALTKWARWPSACACMARMAKDHGYSSKDLQEGIPFVGQLIRDGLVEKIVTKSRYLADEVIYTIPRHLKSHADFIHGDGTSWYFLPEPAKEGEQAKPDVWAPFKKEQDEAHTKALEAEVLKVAAAVAKGGKAGKEAAERAAKKEENKRIRAENVAALATAIDKLKRTEAPTALLVGIIVESAIAGGYAAGRISGMAELVGVKLPKGLPSDNGGQGMRDLQLMRKMDVMDLTRVAVAVLLSRRTDDANKNAWRLPEALEAVMNMPLPEVKVNVGDVVAWDYAGAGDIVGEVVSVEEYEKSNGPWLTIWSRESSPVRPTSWPKCYSYEPGFIHVHKTADLRVVRRAEPKLLLDVPATPKAKKAKAARVKKTKPAKAGKKGGRK